VDEVRKPGREIARLAWQQKGLEIFDIMDKIM
jgi:hypothetical protein